MQSLWGQGNISVILFPSRSFYNSVFEEMKKWVEDGLIAPALWVFPEDIEVKELEPAHIKSIVCGKNKDGIVELLEVDIFEQLARAEFENVRLVAVRAFHSNTADDKVQKNNLVTLANYVEWSLPLPSARDGDKRFKTKLFKINLIAAPSQLHSSDFRTSTEDTWDANVIASPEDRSTPWAGDAFVRSDKKFAKFVAMHVASIGALWNGISHSPFEILERENSQRGQFWVSRVFVNAILTDGLSRRVTAQVLKDIANPNSDFFDPRFGVQIPGTFVLDEGQAESYVDWMVDIVFGLENSSLSFKGITGEEEPAKENWYEWAQIKSFFVFSWDKIKVIPWWMWVWVRRAIGRKLTRTFQGSEGKATVGISQTDTIDARDKILTDQILRLQSAEESARKALISPFLKRATKSSANLWRDIRKLVFGMLDGSDLTKFGLNPQDDRVPVFAHVSQVIQDPNDKYEVTDDIRKELSISSINWQNLEVTDSVIGVENRKLQDLREKLESNLKRTVEIDTKIEEYRKLSNLTSVKETDGANV